MSREFVELTLRNGSVVTRCELDFAIADESHLQGVEAAFLRMARDKALSIEAIGRFNGDCRALGTAMPYCDGSHQFDVGPGDGVYFPSTSPRMTRSERSLVRLGDWVSVSFGVVFYTSRTRRVARLHVPNRWLRRLGLQPSAPGARPWLDALKYPLACAMVSFKKTLRGYASAGI